MRYALSDINVNKCDNILSKTLKKCFNFFVSQKCISKTTFGQ